MALGTITTIAGLILQGYGLWKSEQDEQAAIEDTRRREREAKVEQRGMLARTTAEARRQERIAQRELRRQWQWKEEDRNYNRARDFTQNFLSLLDREPVYRSNLMKVWQR